MDMFDKEIRNTRGMLYQSSGKNLWVGYWKNHMVMSQDFEKRVDFKIGNDRRIYVFLFLSVKVTFI